MKWAISSADNSIQPYIKYRIVTFWLETGVTEEMVFEVALGFE